MKHIKMLGLAVVAAGAMMAFLGAGSASAAVLCSTTADPCPEAQRWPVGTVLDFSIPSGKSANLTDTAGEPIDSCSTSTVKGELSSSSPATGPITSLTWESCTFPTKTLKTGALTVDKIGTTSNGTVTIENNSKGEGTEVTINTIFFGSCIYGVESGKSVGDITEGNATEGSRATFVANAVAKKLSGSNLACPETAKWSATYVLTSPSTTLSVSSS